VPSFEPQVPPVLKDGTARLLSKQEAADRVGVAVRLIDREVQSGRLRCYRFGESGKVHRIDPDDLAAWVEDHSFGPEAA